MNEEKQITVTEAVEAAQERFLKIAPKGMDFTSEKAFAVQLLNNNDYLKQAALGNPLSLQAAVINVAAIGLSLNPAKKQAYLIPRNIKQKVGGKEQWVTKIFLEPSYMGLCDLATLSGAIRWVQAYLVHEADNFMDNGAGQRPTHEYNAFAKPEDRGPIIGAYCVAKTADGDHLTTIMAMHELLEVRDKSEQWKRSQSGPWKDFFGEQVKKTVIRRAFKTWPKTPDMDRLENAIQISNDNEGFEPILSSPPLGQYTADQKAYFDQMISSSDAVGMFLFTKSIDESVFQNLYHSFEKGSKGKYQGIVDNLCRDGAARLRDVSDGLADCCQKADDIGAYELLDGFSREAIEYMQEHFMDAETAAYTRAILQETAA
jgi:recombination protein RecT